MIAKQNTKTSILLLAIILFLLLTKTIGFAGNGFEFVNNVTRVYTDDGKAIIKRHITRVVPNDNQRPDVWRNEYYYSDTVDVDIFVNDIVKQYNDSDIVFIGHIDGVYRVKCPIVTIEPWTKYVVHGVAHNCDSVEIVVDSLLKGLVHENRRHFISTGCVSCECFMPLDYSTLIGQKFICFTNGTNSTGNLGLLPEISCICPNNKRKVVVQPKQGIFLEKQYLYSPLYLDTIGFDEFSRKIQGLSSVQKRAQYKGSHGKRLPSTRKKRENKIAHELWLCE